MPRRTEPNWRDEVVEGPVPTERAEAVLLDLLGPNAMLNRAVSQKVKSLAAHCATWRAQEAGRPKRRHSTAALRALEAAARRFGETGSSADETEVLEMLLGLCDHADTPFWLSLGALRRQAGLDAADEVLHESLLEHPELIAAAAARAHAELSAQRGPDPDDTLRLIVWGLVDLYEMTTGRRATYQRGKDGAHSHTATSPAGLFITGFFEKMEPLYTGEAANALLDVVIHRRTAAAAGDELITGT